MKRWQDSGVVEDSEEEDLDLSDHAHDSQDIPRKRQKVGHQDGSAPRNTQNLPNATGYNELPGEEVQRSDDTPQSKQPTEKTKKGTKAGDELFPRLRHLLEGNEDGDDWLDRSHVIGYGKQGRSPWRGSTSSNRTINTHSRGSTPALIDVRTSEINTELTSTPPSIEHDGLPPHFQTTAQLTPSIAPDQGVPEVEESSRGASAYPDIDALLPSGFAPRANVLSSAPSSPLSSLPSERAISPPPGLRFLGFDSDVLIGQTHKRLSSPDPQKEESTRADHDSLPRVAGRSLRAREERQLHPYLYEKAQYQQQWRARGLKPVHFHVADKPAPETQDESFSENDSQPSHDFGALRSSPPPAMQSPQVATAAFADSDDDLPDLDELLRRNSMLAGYNGRKRRKMGFSKKLPPLHTTRDRLMRDTAMPGHESGVFDVPLSPPRTDTEPAPRSAGCLRFRRLDETLSQLLTPDVSSATRPTQAAPTLPAQDGGNAVQVIGSSDAASQSESEDSEKERRRIRREQKRIKGVLPASWLKIDLQAQRQVRPRSPSPLDHNATSPDRSPTRIAPVKGVAQKISSMRRPKPRVHNLLDLSHSDSSDHSETNRSRLSQQPRLEANNAELAIAPLPDFDDERMEVDWVDPMLAGSSARRNNVPGKRRKRQPRITEASRDKQPIRIDTSEEQRGLRHRRDTRSAPIKPPSKRPNSNRVRRQRAPQRSILDASNSPASTQAKPQFVRLAERAARQRVDQGRHSPSYKVIRLATRADTRDAHDTLTAWKAGNIAQKPSQKPNRHHAGPAPPQTVDPAHSESPIQTSRRVRKVGPTSVLAVKRQSQLKYTLSRPKEQQNDDQVRAGSSAQKPSKPPLRRILQHNGAQLEALEEVFESEHRAITFGRRINALTEVAASRPRMLQPTRATQLDRYLGSESSDVRINHEGKVALSTVKLPSRPRKRQAQRIEIETQEYTQRLQPVQSQGPGEVDSVDATGPNHSQVLQGLNRFGIRYTTDFNIHPLPLGTYFRQDTLIGSGDLAASLQICNRDLHLPAGRIRIHVADTVIDAGPWTEETASAISKIPRIISSTLGLTSVDHSLSVAANVRANIDHILRSMVRYCSKCIYFLDPVDQPGCVATIRRFVQDLLDLSCVEIEAGSLSDVQQLCLQYALVISNQLVQLCTSDVVFHQVKKDARSLRDTCATSLAANITPSCFHELRSFYESVKHTRRREEGITDQDLAVTSILLLYHCTKDEINGQSRLWDSLNEVLQVDVSNIYSVAAMEKHWEDMFTILPILEIDQTGIAQLGSRFHRTQDNWRLVKEFIERVLALYHNAVVAGGTTLNEYVRVLLTRCHYLVSRWGWWKAEPVLGAIYDFYTSRGLALLEHEESKGMPQFLATIEGNPSLEVEVSDSSFVIFLKLLATTLRGLAKYNVYTARKIGGIAYRFIPNHGRTHNKESEIKQTDLDALRNHFDLLCTLYFAIPPEYRLGIHLMRNLVEPSTSHREVCRYSVKAWSCLLAFQSSSEEPNDVLLPLAAWGQDMLQSHLGQFKLARTEAEQDFAAARAGGVFGVTQAIMNATITSNQRMIVATLVDNLIGIKRALQAAKSMAVTTILVSKISFWDIFIPFDPTERRLLPALDAALEVSSSALATQRRLTAPDQSQANNEESQEYGDASILEAFMADELPVQAAEDVVSHLHEPLSQLMSNIFGADEAVTDELLTKILDTWVEVAASTVASGRRTWMSYVDDYTGGAWFQLRETAQRRKFTPYFLSRIVDSTENPSEDLRSAILTAWLVSLFDRAAVLKHQHTLTASLLNAQWDDPILHNMPFTNSLISGKYHISLHDLRRRRLSMIATVLANIRRVYDDTMRNHSSALSEVRKVYLGMLGKVMQSMKANYLELQASDDKIASSSVRGAYVEFVQEVVTYLQQYTAHICRVDSFFTDSSAFPLPVKDPEYVVGRLRSYVPKLSESKIRTQLAVFIHTLCQRAATEGQQEYLVSQLFMAVDGTLERGSVAAPNLRHVLLTAIFPAYIEPALETKTSWILALPILEATQHILADLRFSTKMNDECSIAAVSDMLDAAMESLLVPIEYAIAHNAGLQNHAYRALALVFDAAKACLAVYQILGTTNPSPQDLLQARFKLSYEAAHTLLNSDEWDISIESLKLRKDAGAWADTRSFAKKQAADADTQHWAEVDGTYRVRDRHMSKEVQVTLGNEDEERSNMKAALAGFCQHYEMIHGEDIRQTTRVDGMFAEMMI